MVVAGGYLLLTRVAVTSGLWMFWGYNAFGLSLVPLLVGIGFLFFDGRSLVGWVLTAVGTLIILAGGIGLVARSLRPGHRQRRLLPGGRVMR